MALAAVDLDLRPPTLLAAMPANAFKPSRVVALALGIALIFTMRRRAQIGEPVVVARAVYVVNLFAGPEASHAKPRQPVRVIFHAIDADYDIAFVVRRPGDLANIARVPASPYAAVSEMIARSLPPSENTCSLVVIEH